MRMVARQGSNSVHRLPRSKPPAPPIANPFTVTLARLGTAFCTCKSLYNGRNLIGSSASHTTVCENLKPQRTIGTIDVYF